MQCGLCGFHIIKLQMHCIMRCGALLLTVRLCHFAGSFCGLCGLVNTPTGNYALFNFIVAIILLSLMTLLVVTLTANIISFSFSSLLSFKYSYFITLISAF